MTNWPERIASDLANAFDGVPVYSNVDPNREYNGGKSIEFNVQRLQTVPTLSGAVFYDFQLVGACRASTFDEANALVEELRENLVPLLLSYETSGDALASLITSQEITADARGLIEGESFYGLLNFTITTKEGANNA